MTTPDHDAVYRAGAERYDRLIEREDRDGNLPAALRAIRPFDGLDVIDLGAGTGRLIRLAAGTARSVRGYDSSEAMLAVARRHLEAHPEHNWSLEVAAHREIPAADASADLVLSGWSLAYDVARPAFDAARLDSLLAAIDRLLRPGGTTIIIETLGTGFEIPSPPERLVPYYAALERLGFKPSWIRTDYEFASVAEADELVRFFFGDPLADRLVAANATILPECTGLWSRTKGL